MYLDVGTEDSLDRAGSTEYVPDVLTPDRSAKIVKLKITYRARFANCKRDGLPRVQFCFSAPYDFAVGTGYAKQTYLYDGDGNDVPELWTKGVLPAAPAQARACRACPGAAAVGQHRAAGRIAGGDKDPPYH